MVAHVGTASTRRQRWQDENPKVILCCVLSSKLARAAPSQKDTRIGKLEQHKRTRECFGIDRFAAHQICCQRHQLGLAAVSPILNGLERGHTGEKGGWYGEW